jgi:hypothetical protein
MICLTSPIDGVDHCFASECMSLLYGLRLVRVTFEISVFCRKEIASVVDCYHVLSV